MHFNPAIGRRPNIVTQTVSRSSTNFYRGNAASQKVQDEIHAYIAARDLALAEAERNTSDTTLNRAFLANQLVEICLKPARLPYQAQSLSEVDAARERSRCQNTSSRITELRAAAAAPFFPCAAAA